MALWGEMEGGWREQRVVEWGDRGKGGMGEGGRVGGRVRGRVGGREEGRKEIHVTLHAESEGGRRQQRYLCTALFASTTSTLSPTRGAIAACLHGTNNT